MEVESCRWCEGDGYLPGESAGKRCRYCGGIGKQPTVDQQKVREAFEAWSRRQSDQGYAPSFWECWQAALAHASSAATNPQESSSRLVDARDAARYQFLRDESSADRGEPFIAINVGSISRWTGAYADEKIDQAIAGRRGMGMGEHF